MTLSRSLTQRLEPGTNPIKIHLMVHLIGESERGSLLVTIVWGKSHTSMVAACHVSSARNAGTASKILKGAD